ncbi:MAG: type III-B CRISPR module RAMP protein Cmr6 [Bacteroidota bacterium]
MKGILRCKGSSKWFIIHDESGKRYDVPKEYKSGLNRDIHQKKPCEFELENKKVILQTVDGKPIQIDDSIQKEKEERTRRQEQRRERERREREAAQAAQAAPQQHRPRHQADWLFNRNQQHTKLPKDTRAAIQGLDEEIDNFSMRLNTMAQFPPDERKGLAVLYRKTRRTRDRNATHLSHLPISGEVNYGDLPWQSICERTAISAEAICKSDKLKKQPFEIPLASSVITGLGGVSVFETGITLHHTYGIPYLPASSLKGITRSWVIFSEFDNKEWEAIRDQGFCDLFGCPDKVAIYNIETGKKTGKQAESWYQQHEPKEGGSRQGKICFFDAYPEGPPKIKEDVMNPHYPKYYQHESAPTDFQNPVPIPFLVVDQGRFQLLVGERKGTQSKGQCVIGTSEFGSMVDAAFQFLTQALTHHGIGAKTAVGYGFMRSTR